MLIIATQVCSQFYRVFPRRAFCGLFYYYINDLPSFIESSFVFLFADDSSFFFQSDINSLHQWSTNNLMTFNNDKTALLRFPNSQDATNYYLNSREISVVTLHNDLGILLSIMAGVLISNISQRRPIKY